MATNREFAAQIIDLVLSRLPDHVILEVVGRRLGQPSSGFREPRRGPAKPAPKRGEPPARAPRGSSVERQELLATVERIVRAGTGLSASDVARAARLTQSRAAAALKELKLGGRIFQGGDRRFARYAGDAKLATQASATARQTAPGPIVGAKASSTVGRGNG